MDIVVSAAGHVGFVSADGQATIAPWGLAPKARAENAREPRAIRLAGCLRIQTERIVACDPVIERVINNAILRSDDRVEAVRDAYVPRIAIERPQLSEMSLDEVRDAMSGSTASDALNSFNPISVKHGGMTYVGFE